MDLPLARAPDIARSTGAAEVDADDLQRQSVSLRASDRGRRGLIVGTVIDQKDLADQISV